MGSKKEEKVVLASLGNPVSSVSPSEKSRVAMKGPSLSDSEIVFAQPRYSENPKPLYPQEARKKGYEGEVLLRVEVLSNGRVGEIEVRRSSGHEVLDRSAITAMKQWKFVPAKKAETQVPVWVNIPVTFQLR
jgi:protein TonB